MTRTVDQEHNLFLRFKNEPSVIGEIYDLFADPLYGYLLKRCGRKELAEDLVSQTFLKLLEARPSLEWRGISIRAWIFSVASNAFIDYTRKSSTKQEMDWDEEWDPPSTDDPAWNAQLVCEGERLKRIMSSLSARDQYILDRRFFAGLEPVEIGSLLNVSPNHASVLVYRAIGRLRQAAIAANLV
jgi:RNA polymerase sigma-70 factor (ECF subfamily)